MQTDLDLVIVGDVVERQELLNGTQIVTLEGRSDDGMWEMSGLLSWSVKSPDAAEGDITLSGEDGAEIFATLTTATVSDEGSGAHSFRLEYEIDGGSAAYAEAAGAIRATGAIEETAFRGTWFVRIVDADA